MHRKRPPVSGSWPGRCRFRRRGRSAAWMLGLTTGKVLASPQPRSPQRRPRRGHRRVLEVNAGDGGGLDGVDADVAPIDVLLGAAAAREVPADERDMNDTGDPWT